MNSRKIFDQLIGYHSLDRENQLEPDVFSPAIRRVNESLGLFFSADPLCRPNRPGSGEARDEPSVGQSPQGQRDCRRRMGQ